MTTRRYEVVAYNNWTAVVDTIENKMVVICKLPKEYENDIEAREYEFPGEISLVERNEKYGEYFSIHLIGSVDEYVFKFESETDFIGDMVYLTMTDNGLEEVSEPFACHSFGEN